MFYFCLGGIFISSTNKTTLGLNQWRGADKPKMADFNSDNAIIDSALRSISTSSTNPNILINGDFQIWQRGTSFVAPNNQYTADRWKANGSGTVSYDGGYKVTGTVAVSYTMENGDFEKINGKTVTLSYKTADNDDIITNTFTASSSVVVNLTVTDKTIEWVKLELSNKATDFLPRLYAEELLLCQRYYECNFSDYNSVMYVISNYSGWARSFISFKASKRVDPIMKIYTNSNKTVVGVRNSKTGVELSDNNLSCTVSKDNVSLIYMSGLTTNEWYDFVWEADSEIY